MRQSVDNQAERGGANTLNRSAAMGAVAVESCMLHALWDIERDGDK